MKPTKEVWYECPNCQGTNRLRDVVAMDQMGRPKLEFVRPFQCNNCSTNMIRRVKK